MNHGSSCGDTLVLELFVQGQSARSNEALDVVHRVCEQHFPGRYRLDVIDIQQQPERTRRANVIAAPVLIRRLPEPERRTVGQLSEARVLQGLGLHAATPDEEDA